MGGNVPQGVNQDGIVLRSAGLSGCVPNSTSAVASENRRVFFNENKKRPA